MKSRRHRPADLGTREAIRAHYEPRISASKANFDILDWASPESQHIRFCVLAENVDLDGKSLLDVGSGLGDLWAFLKTAEARVAYTGVDIVEKMVDAARQRHGDARFVCADIFAEEHFAPGSFDVVFCSGTFNLNLGNEEQFLPFALRRLYGLARQHLVFNLLHERSRFRDRKYAYSRPEEIRKIFQPLGCEVRIVDDYLPNDFTVICRKGQA